MPAVNQIEQHPYFTQAGVEAFGEQHGILAQAWSPIGGITFYRDSGHSSALQDPVIGRIGQEHGKSPAQVMLRWGIQHGRSVIPKSTKPQRIAENLDVFDFELSPDQMAAIDGLDTGRRGGRSPTTSRSKRSAATSPRPDRHGPPPASVKVAAEPDVRRGRAWMTNYAVARLEEIGELNDGREPYRPVRHHFGITSFGVTAWTAPEAGDRIINEHDESEPDSDEELYLVVSGRATFELDGDRVAAPAGTFVFAPPGVKRTAFAEEPGTTVIALGGTPGKAYQPDGWELWAPLNPLYEAGEFAEAADRGRELVATYPQYAGPLYNLACCESLAGRPADAVEHLGQAIARSERFRAYAQDDSDFDAIRDEPAFKALVAGTAQET